MEEKKLSKVIKIIVSIVVLPLYGYLIYLAFSLTIGFNLAFVLNPNWLSDLLGIFLQTLIYVPAGTVGLIAVVGLFVIQPTYFVASKILQYKFDSDTQDMIIHQAFLFTCKFAGGCSVLLVILWSLAYMNM